jgi:hypothetical protein
MAEVRGILVNAEKAFVRHTYGQDAVEKMTATLPAEEIALIKNRSLDASFYPYETMDALRHLIRALSVENPKSVATLAEDSDAFFADHIFNGVYKAFVAKDAPSMVAKIPWVKDYFFRDFEKVEATMTGDASCTLMYQFEPGHRQARSSCISLAGFWARALEIAGGKRVSVTHPTCVRDGADRCEFLLSW